MNTIITSEATEVSFAHIFKQWVGRRQLCNTPRSFYQPFNLYPQPTQETSIKVYELRRFAMGTSVGSEDTA